MDIMKFFKDLNNGIDFQEQSLNIIATAGQNNNSLDVIMPGEPTKRIYTAIEDIGAKGGLAFTITFTDQILFKFKEKYIESEINKMIRKTKGVIDHCFVSEFSATGRFHMHGAILFKEIKNVTNLRRKLSKFGITKVKAIDNSPGWAAYCTKSMAQPVKPCGDSKVV